MVRKRSQMQLSQSRSFGEFRTLKKSSSCSTIYIDDSTVSQPNLKNTIKCVSLAIYYHIKNRKSSVILDIFDEKLHPLTVSTIVSNITVNFSIALPLKACCRRKVVSIVVIWQTSSPKNDDVIFGQPLISRMSNEMGCLFAADTLKNKIVLTYLPP